MLAQSTRSISPRLRSPATKSAARSPELISHPRTVFLRALEHGNLLCSETTVREIRFVSLNETLRLTAFVALNDRDRGERCARRWLIRSLAERPGSDPRRPLDRRQTACGHSAGQLTGMLSTPCAQPSM